MPQSQSYDHLRRRADELISDRKTTESTWQEIADNLLGRREFTSINTPGIQRMQRIYDDTAKVSSSLLSGAIHSLLVSPSARWFGFRFEQPELNDIPDARAWLEACEKRIYAAIGSPRANFHAQLAETFVDLINFGTAGIFVDDIAGKGVQFSSRPLPELYLAEDPSGRIDTIVRMFRLTARQAVMTWGDKAKSAKRAVDSGSGEDKASYLHLIMPNDDVVLGNMDRTGMPWASFHLSMDEQIILSEGGFHETPMATPRWEKDSGEIYGRGPGWNALSNQKMLNEIKKLTLKSGQKAISPPLMVDSEGVLPGDLRFHPDAIIPINSVMATMNPPIQPIPFGGDFNIGVALIEDVRKSVQDAFHHQLIETIRDPRMTATQVMELSAQMQRHLAPILGRLQTELLEPILERVFAIEARAGRLPVPPEEISGMDLKIDYVSPIARAQQTSDARAIIDFSGFVSNLAQAVPSVMDNVDFDSGVRQLADALGVPITMIRNTEDVEASREADRQAAAEQMQQEQAVMATDQIAKLAAAAPQQ